MITIKKYSCTKRIWNKKLRIKTKIEKFKLNKKEWAPEKLFLMEHFGHKKIDKKANIFSFLRLT